MTGIRTLFHSGTTGPARKLPAAKAAKFADFSLFLRGSDVEAGSGIIVDGSPTANPLTLIGTPTQGTVSPYSQVGYSVEFDGSSGLRTPNSSTAFPIWQTGTGGTGAWSMDLFAIFEEDTNEYKPLLVNSNGADATGFALAIDTDGTLVFRVAAANAGWTRTLSTTWRPTPGAWHHIHVARSTTAFVIAADGVRLSNITIPTGEVYTPPTLDKLYVGENPFFPAGTGSYFKGRMHGVRLRNSAGVGVAATYVVPISLAPNTAAPLLIAQTNRYVDVGFYATKAVITTQGVPKVVIGNPFQPTFAYYQDLNGGSAYFNGTTDAINCPLNAALTSSTNVLTMDAWVYPENLKPQSTIYGDANASGANGSFQFFLNETGNLCFTFYTGATTTVTITSTLKIVMGQWNHIGFNRSAPGNQLSFACNGVTHIIPAAFTGNFRTGTRPTIGRNGDTTSVDTYFSGIMAYPRYVKAASYGAATYAVPTVQVGAAAGLYPLFNTSRIFDRTLSNPIVAMNGAVMTTSRKLANNNSFDLTGNKYLTMPNSSKLTPGLKNFTMRLWVYKDSLGAGEAMDRTSVLFEQYTSGSDYTQLKILSTGQLQLDVNGEILFTTAETELVPVDAWTSIFVSRLDATLFAAINGNQVVNVTALPTQRIGTISATRTVIGGVSTGVSANAYIDDFVLSLGTAEYVSNYTPLPRTMTGQEQFTVNHTAPFALTSIQSISEQSFSTTTAIPTIITNTGDVQIRNSATVTQVVDSNLDQITMALSNVGHIPVGGSVSGTGYTNVIVGGSSSRTFNCTFGVGRYTIPVTLTSNHRIAVKTADATATIENYTIPATAEYLIQIIGACAGFNNGYNANGTGAEIWCRMNLTGGAQTKILVGGQGASSGVGAGGGGTFFTTSTNSPILVAGGSGGSQGGGFSSSRSGGQATKGGSTAGSNGAGLVGDGVNCKSFVNGGLNTVAVANGYSSLAGFGGGGSDAVSNSGGGGGYSGGATTQGGTSWWPASGVTLISAVSGVTGDASNSTGGFNGYLRMARNA